MDRRLILAVAGSGKTKYIIDLLDGMSRFLIVTYTDNNLANIRGRIISKFGYLPHNITLMSYFQFLIRMCYRPFLKDEIKAKGIIWNMPNPNTLKLKRNNLLFYLTQSRYMYYNRIAKLCMDRCSGLIKERIEKFYDYFMIDEVQDLGGHDFNLIQAIMPMSINCIFVGDFYQHTFDTSNDGNVNRGLYNDYEKYKKQWVRAGVTVDEITLSNSHRCSPTVCDFVKQQLGINIASYRQDDTRIVLVETQDEADSLFCDNTRVKLFFQESNRYLCYAENWGKSKGLDDFQDVCIVLNKTTFAAYDKKSLYKLTPPTRNKLYVACTRARGDIYLIPYTFIDKNYGG